MRLNNTKDHKNIHTTLIVVLLFSMFISACGNTAAAMPEEIVLPISNELAGSSRPVGEVPKSNVQQENPKLNSEDPLSPEQSDGEARPAEPVTSAEMPDLAPAAKSIEGSDDPAAATPVNEQVSDVQAIGPAEPRIGFAAPDFSLMTLDGSQVKLSELRGQPVMINYWASWCIPCRDELPILQRLYKEYQSRGLVMLSVNAIEQDNLDKVKSDVSEFGMSFPVLLDDGEQFWKSYQVLFLPTTFFVDASGVIRDITLGDSSEDSFRAKIENLLVGDF